MKYNEYKPDQCTSKIKKKLFKKTMVLSLRLLNYYLKIQYNIIYLLVYYSYFYLNMQTNIIYR